MPSYTSQRDREGERQREREREIVCMRETEETRSYIAQLYFTVLPDWETGKERDKEGERERGRKKDRETEDTRSYIHCTSRMGHREVERDRQRERERETERESVYEKDSGNEVVYCPAILHSTSE